MFNFYDRMLRNAPDPAGGGAPPAPPVPPAPPAPPAAPEQPWFAGHPDEAVRNFLTEKQIGDPNVAATKLFHAEKALSGAADVVPLPGENATPEQRAAFFDKLGRPKEAAAYDFGLPADAQVDEGFQGWAKETFHKHGLTASQAKDLVNDWHKYVTDYYAKETETNKVAEDKVIADLKTVHGGNFDQFVADGQKAFNALGLSADVVSALQKSAGSAAYLTLMSALGKKMGGEARFVDANGGQGNDANPATMTKEQAQAAVRRLEGDAEFNKKYLDAKHPEHNQAVERMLALQKVVHG